MPMEEQVRFRILPNQYRVGSFCYCYYIYIVYCKRKALFQFNGNSFQNAVITWRMFINRLLIELPQDRGQLSTTDLITSGSMLRLIRASINENAKTRPFTSYDVGDSHNIPSLDTDKLGLRMKKNSPCIYTGVIQVICRLWQLREIKGRTVSSGQPMFRPLHRFGRNWTEMMDATFFAAKGRKKK